VGPDLNDNLVKTPLDEDEREDLIIRTINTRGELDEFEQANIEKAVEWSLNSRFTHERILTIDFLKILHRRMFSEVWKWAGRFRKTNKNIGVDKHEIEQHLHALLDDCLYWIRNSTYDEDTIAIRVKYRLVQIHPFPDGNGRHSRLCADILISHVFHKPVFSWGSKDLRSSNDSRARYLEAIRQADQEIFEPLVQFARS
jgi:Fic-DOC domain mobile mystery protein B